MLSILTQSKALINLDNITTISMSLCEDNKIAIVADQSYILGYYDNEATAIEVVMWIAESIGTHSSDINMCLTMPIIDNEDKQDAEND